MSIVEKQIAILTKHEKQHCVACVLETAFNTQIIHTDKFDTDKLGTFDHKIQRKLRADESALKKAYIACELTQCNQGLGSEGSFNSHFGVSLMDQELVAFVDIKRRIEIIAIAEKSMPFNVIEAGTAADLANKLSANAATDSDKQRWMIWSNDGWKKGVSKSELLKGTYPFPIKIEPDLRAMCCPERMEVIKLATEDLVKRLNAICPNCDAPNFVKKHDSKKPDYLLCELCLQPTNQLKPPVKRCDKCGYEEQTDETPSVGSAFYCNYCNP